MVVSPVYSIFGVGLDGSFAVVSRSDLSNSEIKIEFLKAAELLDKPIKYLYTKYGRVAYSRYTPYLEPTQYGYDLLHMAMFLVTDLLVIVSIDDVTCFDTEKDAVERGGEVEVNLCMTCAPVPSKDIIGSFDRDVESIANNPDNDVYEMKVLAPSFVCDEEFGKGIYELTDGSFDSFTEFMYDQMLQTYEKTKNEIRASRIVDDGSVPEFRLDYLPRREGMETKPHTPNVSKVPVEDDMDDFAEMEMPDFYEEDNPEDELPEEVNSEEGYDLWEDDPESELAKSMEDEFFAEESLDDEGDFDADDGIDPTEEVDEDCEECDDIGSESDLESDEDDSTPEEVSSDWESTEKDPLE